MRLRIEFKETRSVFHVKLDAAYKPSGGGGDIPEYAGEYEVTPRLNEQILPTQNTRMRDDVTVHEIPITRTSNPQDGLTVLIG